MDNAALVLERVTKRFGDFTAVSDVGMTVPRGAIWGFLGPNGAGKTTTIRMIMNVIHPDEGSIRLLGTTRIGDVRSRIGYLPEERGLYRKMTVRAILAYFAALKGMESCAIDNAISLWLERMELTDWRDRKIENLSKGMQQKIQFIATMINNPDLIILDEPFTGLDPLNLELIRNHILRFRDEGSTVILSTHMMDHAERLCDGITLVDRGKVVIDGRLDAIRSDYSSNALKIVIEGGPDALPDVPGIMEKRKQDGAVVLILEDGVDHQKVLRDIMTHHRVTSFQIATPTLHDLFVRLVGEGER